MVEQNHDDEYYKFDLSGADINSIENPHVKEFLATLLDCHSRGHAYYCPRCRYFRGTDPMTGLSFCSQPTPQGGWVVDELETVNGVEPMAQCRNFAPAIER